MSEMHLRLLDVFLLYALSSLLLSCIHAPPAECDRPVATGNSPNGGQVALLVKLGHKAILPCHHCVPKLEQSMNWFRLDREVTVVAGGTVWRPLEVELDTHDDERLNRVYVTPRHQLVISDFQPDDVGSYFCMQYDPTIEARLAKLAFRSAGSVGGGAAGAAAAWSKVTGKDKIDMVVHVDIEIPKKEVLVTKSGEGYPKPKPRYFSKTHNVEVLTEWEKWGSCSTCGGFGVRRRRGSCLTRLFDQELPASPPHLDHVLRFYTHGAPCQSSLLTSRDLADLDIANWAPEVEIERCEIECEKKKGIKDGFVKLVSHFKLKSERKTHKVDKKKLTHMEGKELFLFCNGIHADSAVQWKNGSDLLDALFLPIETAGRVSVGADNSLHILRLILSDAQVYTCVSDGRTHMAFTITVTPRPAPPEDVHLYMMYLGYALAANTIIFIFLLAVRHKERVIQVKKNFASPASTRNQTRQKRLVPESTSSSSSISPRRSSSDDSSD